MFMSVLECVQSFISSTYFGKVHLQSVISSSGGIHFPFFSTDGCKGRGVAMMSLLAFETRRFLMDCICIFGGFFRFYCQD